jgi:hypothetical protein
MKDDESILEMFHRLQVIINDLKALGEKIKDDNVSHQFLMCLPPRFEMLRILIIRGGCVLCDEGIEETIDHLFFDCYFAKQCWEKLGINWINMGDIHRRIERSRQMAGLPFFMEIFLIVAWELWKMRNRLVFDGIEASFNRWLHNIREEAALQSDRIIDPDRTIVRAWLDAL